MRPLKLYLLLIIFFNILSSSFGFNKSFVTDFAAKKGKEQKINFIDPYPLSFYLSLSNGYPIPIHIPESNYFIELGVNAGIGFGMEYRFTKWTAIDLNFNVNFGFLWERKNYEDMGAPCYYEFYKEFTLDMFQYNLYLQQLVSFKFYTNEFPIKWKITNPKNKNKKINKEIKGKVFFRLGATLDGWIFSKYMLYRNDELFTEGSFLDDVLDGPNPYGDMVNYQWLANPIVIGPHICIGFKFYKGDVFSFQPELRVTFSGLPVMDGAKEWVNLRGNDLIMVRNNGENDAHIQDYRITVEFVSTFSFTVKELKLDDKVIRIVLDFLNFYPDSTKLLPESERKLKLVSLTLFKYKNMKFKFVGHANSTGNRKNEFTLSVERAKSIREYLIKLGATTSANSTFEGRGSTENIGSTVTEFGKRKNRRVEILITE